MDKGLNNLSIQQTFIQMFTVDLTMRQTLGTWDNETDKNSCPRGAYLFCLCQREFFRSSLLPMNYDSRQENRYQITTHQN